MSTRDQWRGHNNQALVSEDRATEIVTSLNLSIGRTVFTWISGPDHDFEQLVGEVNFDINMAVEMLGGRLPGGKNINSHDRELMLLKGLHTGLQILGQAKYLAKSAKLAKEITPDAMSAVNNALDSLMKSAVGKEE